jgi:hypothetical protein
MKPRREKKTTPSGGAKQNLLFRTDQRSCQDPRRSERRTAGKDLCEMVTATESSLTIAIRQLPLNHILAFTRAVTSIESHPCRKIGGRGVDLKFHFKSEGELRRKYRRICTCAIAQRKPFRMCTYKKMGEVSGRRKFSEGFFKGTGKKNWGCRTRKARAESRGFSRLKKSGALWYKGGQLEVAL